MLTQERLLEVLDYDRETGVFRWRIARGSKIKAGSVTGTKDRDGYLVIWIDYVRYKAHQLAWFYVHGEWPRGVIDHRNGERADNAIANLRDVSREVNQQNMRRATVSSKTGVLGVSFDASRMKFAAYISVDGRTKRLGRFQTADEASAAYLAAKRQLHPGNTL